MSDWKHLAKPAVILPRRVELQQLPEVDDYMRPPPEERSLLLRLPLPPSANRLVRPGTGTKRLVKAKEAKGWHATVAAVVAETTRTLKPMRIVGPVSLVVTFYVRTVSADISNRLKALEDALTFARVWHDDSQVVRIEATKALAAKGSKGWCEVRVGAYRVEDAELRHRLSISTRAGGTPRG